MVTELKVTSDPVIMEKSKDLKILPLHFQETAYCQDPSFHIITDLRPPHLAPCLPGKKTDTDTPQIPSLCPVNDVSAL